MDVKASGSMSSSVTGLTKKEVALLDKDIRYSNESNPNWRRMNEPLISPAIMLMFVLSILLYFIPGMLHISRSRLDKTKGIRIAKRAYKTAISDLLETGSAEEIYASIHKGLNSFINSKTHKIAERSNTEILSWIQEKSALDFIFIDD